MSDEPKKTSENTETSNTTPDGIAKPREIDMDKHREPVVVVPKENQDRKSGSKKGLWAALIVIILIIVAGGVTIAVLRQQSTKTTSTTPATTKFASSNAIIKSISPKLSGQVLDTIVTSGLGGKTADGYGTYGVAAYKVGSRAYKNLPTVSTGIGYKGDSSTESKNYTTLANFFATNNFKKLSSGTNASGPLSWSDTSVTYIDYASYESADQVCLIWHVDASPTPVAAHIASVGCADKSSYEASAKVLDPIYAAYAVGDVKPGADTVLAFPTAGDGSNGYKNAVVLQQDSTQLSGLQAEALYYQAPGKTEWNYFMSTRGQLSCSDYNTDTLKQAFHGLPCYNDTTAKVSSVI